MKCKKQDVSCKQWNWWHFLMSSRLQCTRTDTCFMGPFIYRWCARYGYNYIYIYIILNVNIYIFRYIYIYVYSYIHQFIYAYIHQFIYVCTYTSIHVCIYICLYYVHLCMYVYVSVCVYVRHILITTELYVRCCQHKRTCHGCTQTTLFVRPLIAVSSLMANRNNRNLHRFSFASRTTSTLLMFNVICFSNWCAPLNICYSLITTSIKRFESALMLP